MSVDNTFVDAADVDKSKVRKLLSAVPLSVQDLDFGGIGDDVTDDANAWQSFIDAVKGVLPGASPLATYKLFVSDTASFLFGNGDGSNPNHFVHRAVKLDGTDIYIEGFGTVIRPYGFDDATTELQFAFASDKNMTIGTVARVVLKGLRFDFNPDLRGDGTNLRGIHMVGFDGLKFIDTEAFSSGDRGGYFAHLQNGKNVEIRGHRHSKVTGGFNFRYVNGVRINVLNMDGFSEALDFDSLSVDVQANVLNFESTERVNQCMDLNSVIDGLFTNITAKNTGNIATINFKATTPLTYEDYVDGVVPGFGEYTESKRITISHVRGSQIGHETHPHLIISPNWAGNPHPGTFPSTDITLSDWALDDCGYLRVREGKRIIFRDYTLRNLIAPAGAAGVYLQSQIADDDQIAWSDLDVELHNFQILGCANNNAVDIQYARRAVINGLVTRDVEGTFSLRILNPERRGGEIFIDGLNVDKSVSLIANSANIPAWQPETNYVQNAVVKNGGSYYRVVLGGGGTSGNSGGPTGTGSAITDGSVTWEWMPYPFRIVWGRNNYVRGDISTSGDAAKYTFGRREVVTIGDVGATGQVRVPLLIPERKCYVCRLHFALGEDVAGDSTDYRTLTFRKHTLADTDLTIASVDTQNGWNAFEHIDGGWETTEANARMDVGETLWVDITSNGAGVALSGLIIEMEVLDL